MKTTHLLTLVCVIFAFFFSCEAVGQISTFDFLETERFNAKINLAPFVPGKYRTPAVEFGLEYRLNPKWSLQTSVFAGRKFYSKSNAEFNTASGNSIYRARSISYLQGWGVTSELRYYLSHKHGFEKGFYCGGYIRGLSMKKVKEDFENDRILEGDKGMILGVGLNLGYKIKLGKWTLEPLIGLAAGWNQVWDSLPRENPELGDPIYQAIWVGANEVVQDIERSTRHVPLWRGEISLGYSF